VGCILGAPASLTLANSAIGCDKATGALVSHPNPHAAGTKCYNDCFVASLIRRKSSIHIGAAFSMSRHARIRATAQPCGLASRSLGTPRYA
jgi:hypothetical protein